MQIMTFSVRKFNVLLLAASASMAVQYMMTLASTVIAGNLLGEYALGGVNLVSSPLAFLNFVSMLVALGGVISYAAATGRFNERKASQIFGCGLIASICCGVLFALLFFLIRDSFLNFMGADVDTLKFAREYWNYFVLVALVLPLATYLTSMVYCDGDGVISFVCYLVQLLVNCSCGYLLCKWIGVGGCALGIVLSNLAAIAILSIHFFKKSNSLKFVWYFSMSDLGRMCKSAFGDASVNLCWALLYFILNKFVISEFGADKLPVVAAVLAATGFTMIFDGMGSAIQPLVGVYVGEKNYVCIRRVMKAAEITALAEGGCLALLLLAFPQVVLKVVGIASPEVAEMTCTAVRIMSISFIFWAFVFLFNSYYLFVERELVSCLLTALKDFVFPVFMFVLGGKIFGFNGLWIGFSLAAPVAIAVFSLILLKHFGMSQYPLLLPRERDANITVWDLSLDSMDDICRVSAELARRIGSNGGSEQIQGRAALLVEEVLMAIRDRNAGKTVHAEISLDLNDGTALIMRDDGVIFDITDCDAKISSLRTYLVSVIMGHQEDRKNLTTTGFNRNVFRF